MSTSMHCPTGYRLNFINEQRKCFLYAILERGLAIGKNKLQPDKKFHNVFNDLMTTGSLS